MSTLSCPSCGTTGEQILGHIERGVYDGVLWWECLACGWGFPRDFGDWARLNVASVVNVEEYNERRRRETVGPPG